MDKIILESSFVNSLFKCLLCHELLHYPTVINQCLHRFCKLCITNYFEKNTPKTCPICRKILLNPFETLKSDLIFQRLMYKLFPNKIACKITNDSMSIQLNTKLYVYLNYWDISLDRFPIGCYLECQANTPLIFIEKFLRIKYSISSMMKIEFFYQSILLNNEHERLIDICHSFDNQKFTLHLRFFVSSCGYKSILKQLHASKIEPDHSTLKVKICRSQNSKNDWFISQSTLPDLIKSCRKKRKAQRRIRFIPTMVKIPPSIIDCISNQSNNTFLTTEKTICKVQPYIPENLLVDNNPLDLSLK